MSTAIQELPEEKYVDSKLHEDIGYLKASVKSLSDALLDHMQEEKENLQGLKTRINAVYLFIIAVLVGNDISVSSTIYSIKDFINIFF